MHVNHPDPIVEPPPSDPSGTGTEGKRSTESGGSCLSNLMLLAASLLVAFVCGEGLVRLAMGDDLVRFPRFHVRAEYGDFVLRKLRPNSRFVHSSADGVFEFRTNAQGFRDDRDYTRQAAPGVVRVLVLGDSHTQGFEVDQEDTYSKALERHLASAGLEAEALNTGISGFGTAEELVFLAEEGLSYAPQYVVLGFYGNDFEDNVKSDLFRLDSDTLRVNRRQHTPGVRILELHDSIGMLRWLSQYSYLYGFIMNAIWDMAKHVLQSVRNEQFQEAYAIPVEAIQEAEQVLALRLIQRLAEVCRENGAELILIDIPVAREHGFSPSVPPSLRDEFAAAADHYLASEELFAELSNEGRLFVPHGQRHISASAHERIGQAVAEVITADLLGDESWTGSRCPDTVETADERAAETERCDED